MSFTTVYINTTIRSDVSQVYTSTKLEMISSFKQDSKLQSRMCVIVNGCAFTGSHRLIITVYK